ncbi:hypothetical protein NIES4103_57870 [Nostoc sp. NIES-4103]|nr:hypothetical protein NIES4103_57870 [Nostoc sp. NIES-4103]
MFYFTKSLTNLYIYLSYSKKLTNLQIPKHKERKHKEKIMKSENAKISETLIIVQTGSANLKTLNINTQF